MSIEAVIEELLSDPSITDLVGGRIELSELDEGTEYPAIAYQVVHSTPDPYLDSDEGPQPVRARVQINPLDSTVSGVIAIHEAIRSKLDGLQNIEAAGLLVTCITRELEGPWSKDPSTKTWTRAVDYLVNFNE